MMVDVPVLTEEVRSVLSSAPALTEMPTRRLVSLHCTLGDLPLVAHRLAAEPGVTFCHLFGVDERASADRFRLHLIWALDRSAAWLEVSVDLDGHAPWYSSLTPLLPAAHWAERALWDDLGIEPREHPGLRRLCRPAGWPPDRYLLRSDHPWSAPVTLAAHAGEDELPPLAPAPHGVVDYPLGPVRSGVVESGHYTLRTVGEELVDLRLQLSYKHRGVEKRAEGLDLRHLPLVAEHISGTSAFAHSLAACQASEMATGTCVPERARYLRTMFAELERLYNHLGFQADLCQATGLVVGQAQFEILKERLLRLNASMTGHRYLFGLNVPGGLTRDIDAAALTVVRNALEDLKRDFSQLELLLRDSPSHLDRLEGTGILQPDDARAYGAVGPIGRASALDRDLRRDHPYAAYDLVDFTVPVQTAGDAEARFRIRLAETWQAIHIAAQVIDTAPDGPVWVQPAEPVPGATGLGWAESPRGESLHWLTIGQRNTIGSYRVRPASFANWHAFPLAVPGHNILTDFPVIEQSFGLSIAGADR
jgi:Ni,Fe-hydrogenase III large subunit/Ni,Fe-hydrogenase III component G